MITKAIHSATSASFSISIIKKILLVANGKENRCFPLEAFSFFFPIVSTALNCTVSEYVPVMPAGLFQQVAEANSVRSHTLEHISAEAKQGLLYWRWSVSLAGGWSSSMFSVSWLNTLSIFLLAPSHLNARQAETHSHVPRLARGGTFKAFPPLCGGGLYTKLGVVFC